VKILQIAYYYPPMGGAGVQRGLKFSKYLPLHGIEPVVLAGDDPHYVQDPSLLAEVPSGLELHRIRFSPWLARLAAQRRQPARAGTPAAPAPLAAAAARPWRDAALRAVRALQWPDDSASWAHRALRSGRAVIRAAAARGAPIELVFSSSPPVSAHVLGHGLAQEFGLPWVADFRDLWTDNPAYDAASWRRALDRRQEQRWLEQASGVVTVTPSWRELLAARTSGRVPVAFIPNGYDEDDFVGLETPHRDESLFSLVHTGTFYGPRDPAGLLGGLARYLDGPRPGHPALRVRLIGNMGARFAQTLHGFSVRYPGVVECLPYRPHREALAELVAADALLLVVGGGRGPAVRGWLPGKIFEYLRSGRPVLTLGDAEGDAARLIRDHASGPVVDGDDPAAIARALARLLQNRVGAAVGVPPSPSAVFERRELAHQLADFLRQSRDRHAARAVAL
jgi:glycosyltransferase involved in cell wall biosynthesis